MCPHGRWFVFNQIPLTHLPSRSVMPVAHNPGNRSEGAVSRAAGEIPERLLWAWLVLALLMAALACYRIATQEIVLGSPRAAGYTDTFSPSVFASS